MVSAINRGSLAPYIDSALASPEVARLGDRFGFGFGNRADRCCRRFWVARLIGRPCAQLAKAAESVRDLDFDAIGPAGRSRIRGIG